MTLRVHFHTDCAWFAGCENMLVNLLSTPESRRAFDVSLSYRATERYTAGLTERIRLDFPVFPLTFPDPSLFFPAVGRWPRPLSRLGRFISRQFATLPLLLHEIWLLHKLLLRLKPDILHINNGGYPGALSARAAAIAGRLAGVPCVVMVVNNLAVGYDVPARWVDYVLDRLVASSVSQFVTGSAAAARRLGSVLQLDEGRCVALPNGIAMRQADETTQQTRARLGLEGFDGIVFGVVAIIEARKGHKVLLEALNKIVRAPTAQSPTFKVLLEGHGPLREELQVYLDSHGLSRHCAFVGDEANVMNFMSAIDVLLLPSVEFEDFPNVILEAMSLGKPVVASRLAGTPEQVSDGTTGLLVPPRDVDALAAAIVKLAGDTQLREEMGRAGRIRFQKLFTAGASVKCYAKLYHSLMGGNRTS